MYVIERQLKIPQPITSRTTMQETIYAQVLKSAENVVITSHEATKLQTTIDLSKHWGHTVSPFYNYTLTLMGNAEATLAVSPKKDVKAAANRFHSIVTNTGEIVSQRGRRIYRLQYKASDGAHETLGIVVSSPVKGRRVTREHELVATVAMALYPIFSDDSTKLEHVDETAARRFISEVAKRDVLKSLP